MKIGSLIGGLLPLLLLVACGGETPTKSSTPKSTPAPSKPATSKPATSKPATLAGDAAASKTPSGDASDAAVSAKPVATQAPKKKRIRRPRVDYRMLKMILGNDPPSPKAPVEATAEMIALGNALYHSESLSQKGNISCASCHDLSTYGVDNKTTSPGSTGKNGERNTPTTYNAARHFRQHWDGLAESVEEQAMLSVLDPMQHGLADEAVMLAKINEQKDLVDGFTKAFPGDAAAVSAKNFGIAIGAFERTLVTRSKWDDYIEGNQKALSNEELLGLKTFVAVGCTTCHLSKLLGGNAYQKLGLRVPYVGKDTGRMKLTGSVADKYSFKVPSLLNVEMTAPYYHDGSLATLEDAVKAMGKNQLALDLNDEQVENIVVFLKALTGKLPEEFANK
jgi:cytochrome c peroxidase